MVFQIFNFNLHLLGHNIIKSLEVKGRIICTFIT
jgi:hypothetical protein